MRLALPIAFLLVACGDDSSPTDTNDTRVDPDTADTTPDGDDAEDTDAAPDSEDTADTAPDSADTDVVAPCVPAEEIFDDPRIITCGGALTFVFFGEDLSPSACPSYYRFNDTKYPTLEALAAAHGCDATCEYRAAIGVDLIGCVSGSRTGYEEYRPLNSNPCFDAIYSTPIGLLKDLCEWPEKACRADCNEDCAEGTIGTLDAHQFSGAAGSKRGGLANVGQTFRAENAGILTGIELRLTQCSMAGAAALSIQDETGNELAWAELTTVPEGCDVSTDLKEGAPGEGYFAVEGACVPVAIGDTLRFVLQYPVCDTPPCGDGFGLGFATGNPYAPGTLLLDETPVNDEDLTFKVYVK